jgi:hypothetical protein
VGDGYNLSKEALARSVGAAKVALDHTCRCTAIIAIGIIVIAAL